MSPKNNLVKVVITNEFLNQKGIIFAFLVFLYVFFQQIAHVYMLYSSKDIMSEIKDSMEDAGEKMKRGTKKAGNRMEEGAEEAKDKVD